LNSQRSHFLGRRRSRPPGFGDRNCSIWPWVSHYCRGSSIQHPPRRYSVPSGLWPGAA